MKFQVWLPLLLLGVVAENCCYELTIYLYTEPGIERIGFFIFPAKSNSATDLKKP